jgi:hypothetical protein
MLPEASPERYAHPAPGSGRHDLDQAVLSLRRGALAGGRQVTPPPERRSGPQPHWRHFKARDIISMPDKWEYPWFAAWDLAYHCAALALVDVDFAKDSRWS